MAMRIIVLSLIFVISSHTILFLLSLWNYLSQTYGTKYPSQTDNSISANNNTLRNRDCRHNARICDCKHYIHVYNKRKAIKYGTKIRYTSYDVATKDSVWLTKNTKQTPTKIVISYLSSNIKPSNNDTNTHNSPSKNSNMKEKIKVIYVHVDYFASNKYKEIFEETDTNTTKVKSNGNVGNDIEVKMDCIYNESERYPNIHRIINFMNDINHLNCDVFVLVIMKCQSCCFNHFIHSNRN